MGSLGPKVRQKSGKTEDIDPYGYLEVYQLRENISICLPTKPYHTLAEFQKLQYKNS